MKHPLNSCATSRKKELLVNSTVYDSWKHAFSRSTPWHGCRHHPDVIRAFQQIANDCTPIKQTLDTPEMFLDVQPYAPLGTTLTAVLMVHITIGQCVVFTLCTSLLLMPFLFSSAKTCLTLRAVNRLQTLKDLGTGSPSSAYLFSPSAGAQCYALGTAETKTQVQNVPPDNQKQLKLVKSWTIRRKVTGALKAPLWTFNPESLPDPTSFPSPPTPTVCAVTQSQSTAEPPADPVTPDAVSVTPEFSGSNRVSLQTLNPAVQAMDLYLFDLITVK